MAVIDVPDRMTLTAPAPDAVAAATVQTVGRPGLATYYYWIVTHFPIGVVVSEPFGVWDAPNTLNGSNYVHIVWTGSAGATDYDLLRTETAVYPSLPGNYALVEGLTDTQYRDQGQALSSYNLSGLPRGAPVSCLVHLNNRDYSAPVVEMPCTMKVSTLIFSDGSMQWTAGGGGGSAPILIAGPGISLTSSIGPPPTVTITNTVPSQWTNVTGGIAYTAGRVGIGTTNPSHTLEIVTADTGITNMLLRHYYPRAAGFYLSTARGTPAAPLPVQAGDDLGWMGITGRTSTIDGAEAAAISATAVTVGPNFLSADLLFWTADGTVNDVSERMRITSQGYVGIRTQTPQTGLQVNDTVYVTGSVTSPTSGTGVEVWYDAAVGTPPGEGGIDCFDFTAQVYRRMLVDGNPLLLNSDLNNTGHVGINNTAPAFKLDVTGDINCSGTYRVNGAPLSMGGAQVGATPPASPNDGDFWYDTTNFRLFIRFSNAWFQVSA